PNGDGLQIGPNVFTKVSDSTLLPPTHRLKQDMEDIAKGIKIAKTIGGMAAKAAKTIQGTIQPTQEPETGQTPPQSPSVVQQGQPVQSPMPPPTPQNVTPGPHSPSGFTPQTPSTGAVLYCDQCGARSRPGKRFCNNCGARLA
ncbi:MAG TPA: zinc-ribbon domain-containing protein, partial [Ktedonobacteraceae bacterium]|nr:zinc-ribbon domain-containing protein [Ktedonobacteraceae bacterium]